MRSRVLAMLILATLSASLLGCSSGEADSGGTDQDSIRQLSYNSEIEVFVDPNTGVNYLIYDGYSYGGGMTLRVNADGTPYVTPLDIAEEE